MAEEEAVESWAFAGDETDIGIVGSVFGAKEVKDDLTSVGESGISREAESL